MKVKAENSLEYKLAKRIEALPDDVFLRAEIKSLAPSRQLSRALTALINKQKITRIGYGIYAKLGVSPYSQGRAILKTNGFNNAVRISLAKLAIPFDRSEEEKAYNRRESTQIPARPTIVLLKKTQRHFRYKQMEAKFEYR